MIETTDEAVTYLEMVSRREMGDLAEAALLVTRELRQRNQEAIQHAEEIRRLTAEVERLTFIVNDRQERGNELLARAERAEAEAAESLDALIACAEAEDRLRARWPHIEVPTAGSAGLLGRQVLVDPGSPTCLRCSIENELLGPAAADRGEGR